MNVTRTAVRSGNTVLAVLAAASFHYFLNDLIQLLLPAIYPLLSPLNPLAKMRSDTSPASTEPMSHAPFGYGCGRTMPR
jgi:hypothetical protein